MTDIKPSCCHTSGRHVFLCVKLCVVLAFGVVILLKSDLVWLYYGLQKCNVVL
jgi:hypothetical protein